MNSRVVVTNNPAFERYYDPMYESQTARDQFRKTLNLSNKHSIISYIGFPEGDYPTHYHDFVFDSIRVALQKISHPLSFIYWPHRRGTDKLPKQFTQLPDNIHVIFHPQSWWQNRDIGLHKQLIGSDIALMTNSTSSAEAFTAWGKQKIPITVPIDISLTDDFPNLRLNTSLRAQNLVPYLTSRQKLIQRLPEIVASPRQFALLNAPQRLLELEWDQSPTEQILTELQRLHK